MPADATLPERRGSLYAIGFALMAYALFTCTDTCVKWLMVNGYAPSQVIFFNGLFGLICVWTLFRLRRGSNVPLLTQNLKWNLLRAGLICIGAFSVTLALREIAMAEFYAIIFTEPLFITALSAMFFGDKVGVKRWAAVLLGFAGVLIMANPGAGAINLGMVYTLVASVAFSLSLCIVRHMGPDEAPSTLAVYAMASTALVALPFLAGSYTAPAPAHWPIFIFAGLCVGLAIVCMVTAFQHAHSAAVVTPFHYSQIVLGSLAGYVLFAEIPEMRVFIGAAIIISCGLFIFIDEHRAEKKRKNGHARAGEIDPAIH